MFVIQQLLILDLTFVKLYLNKSEEVNAGF